MSLRYTFLLLVSIFPFAILYGQSTVSGKVADAEGAPVTYATVTLVQPLDSSVVAYTITDAGGQYKLTTDKHGNFLIQVRFLGYAAQNRSITVSENALLSGIDFIMEKEDVTIGEVTVKGRQTGIAFKEDTIKYNPEVFKDGTEMVLGDVLNKLPGIEVDEKGNIKAQGKQVEKLLLNGQDFFAGNTQMATKNLPAEIAESVSVINNYSEYSMLSGFQSHEKTVIDVGVNKNNFGKISGELSAAGGAKDKYRLNGNLMQIRPKSMAFVMGAMNNTGDEVFSIEDYIRLQGGANEFIGNSGGQNIIKLSKEEQALLMPANNTYTRKNGLAAINLAYQPRSSFKMNSYFLFNTNKEKSEDDNTYTYILPDNTGYTTTKNSQTSAHNRLLSGYLKMDYQPSTTLTLSYSGVISDTGMEKKTNALDRTGAQRMSSYGYNYAGAFTMKHNVSLLKSFGRHLLMANASFLYNDKPSDYNMEADSLLLPVPMHALDGWYYARQHTYSGETSGSVGITFLFRINGSYFVRTGLNANFTRQNYKSHIFTINTEGKQTLIDADSFRNDYSFDIQDYNSNIGLVKNKGLLRFKVGTSIHGYKFDTSLQGQVTGKNAFEITPEAELSLFFSQKHVLTINGYSSCSLLPTDAFVSGKVFSSYQSYYHSSRVNRLYSAKYNISLNYRLIDMFSNTMVLITGSWDRTENTNTVDYSADGLLTSYMPVLSSPHNNWISRLYISKGLAFIPWALKLTGGYNNFTYYNETNSIENKISIDNTNGKIELTSNYRRLLNFEYRAGIEYSENSTSFGSSSTQTIQRYAGKLNLNINKRFIAYAELEHVINKSSGIRLSQYYLNASGRYFFSKRMGIELTGNNMLNLNNQDWMAVSYNGVYTTERHFRRIPGNIMLKLNWKF